MMTAQEGYVAAFPRPYVFSLKYCGARHASKHRGDQNGATSVLLAAPWGPVSTMSQSATVVGIGP